MHANDDRRQYFRIEDHVYLHWRILDAQEQQALTAAKRADSGSAIAQLRVLSSQTGTILAGIRKSHPEIAQYLALIDKKIDLLARVAEGKYIGDELTANARVSVGAGGIAFRADTKLKAEDHLSLRIVFFPSYLCVEPIGQVTHVEATDSGDYLIGVEFESISEIEREALVRHVLERQSALLRQQRERN